MKVLASSFADPQDIADYERSGSLARGDNGIGCWGDLTAQEVTPMCALPPEDVIAKWGSMKGKHARRKKVRVNITGSGGTLTRKEVVCELADRMPSKKNIKNGAGIDLNPAAAKALGLNPPFLVHAEWEWAE
jgi:hypothetical protein